MDTPTKTTFRLLILAEILLRIGDGVADHFGESSLPEALRNFPYENWYDGASKTVLVTMAGCLALLVLGQIGAYVGLLLFWRPARALYLALVVGEILFTSFFSSFYVGPALSFGLAEASRVVAGVILALVYWSPVKALFERPVVAA